MRTAVVVTALALAGSCGGPPAPPKRPLAESVTVSVSPGASPEITWSPPLPARGVVVQQLDKKPMWLLVSHGPPRITPPLRYASRADAYPDTQESAGPYDLLAGSTYRVVVQLEDFTSVEATFTPQ